MALLLVVRVAEQWSALSLVAGVVLLVAAVLGVVVAMRRLSGR